MPLSSEQTSRLLNQFEKDYSILSTESEVEVVQRAFTAFWHDKILTKSVATLRELDDLDPIVRLLDYSAKRRYDYESAEDSRELRLRLLTAGQQYRLEYTIQDDPIEKRLIVVRSFHVAKCMLTQRDWYRIFKDLKSHTELAEKLDHIFTETDQKRRALLADQLKRLNLSHKNPLTAPQAIAINAMLFCNDPSQFTSVVSLNHRKLIVKAFELGEYRDDWSYGEQIFRSNELLQNLGTRFGVKFSPRKLSRFFYWEPVQVLWKPGRPSASSATPEIEQQPLSLEGTLPTFHQLEEPEKKEIAEIVKLVKDGQMAIPMFQREFVWGRGDIVDLFESILRGYYVGSILLWAVDGDPDLKVEPIYGTPIPEEKLKPRYIVLDGQQRISSIYYGTMAPNLRLWNTTRPYVFFVDLKKLLMIDKLGESINLVVSLPRNMAERRSLMTREGQFSNWYFPIFEFQNFHEWLDDFEEFLQSRLSDQHEQVREVRKRLREYLRQVWEKFEIPIIKLPQDMSLVDVAKIFEKLNSTGVVLTVFDLLNARMVKHGVTLREWWDKVRDSESFPRIRRFSEGNERFPVYMLQTIALLRGKPTKSEELLKLSPDNFQADWERACTAIERALTKATNMRDGFGVISPKWLPYSTMMPVLALLLDRLELRSDKPKCIEKIGKWYWSSIVTHAYSGSTDSQIALDSRQMLEWFDEDTKVPETVQEAKADLESMKLKGMVKTSDAIYKSVMCLVALKGGRDFRKVNMLEFSTLDDHHIFPQSRAEEFKAGDHINAIVNKTLIDKDTNEKYVRDSRPSEYLRRIMKEQGISEEELMKRLETHLVNREAFDALLADDFDTFISKRDEHLKQIFTQLASAKL
jgi:hypothetical protein